MGGTQSSVGVLVTPAATEARRAEVRIERTRVVIVIDGHRSEFARAEVRFADDRPGRVEMHIGRSRLFFRPDRAADCRWLARGGTALRRLPVLGLEGAFAPESALPNDAGDPDPGSAHPESCEWVVRSRNYGIVRSVCRYCRAVSIDLTGNGADEAPADPYEASATKAMSSTTSSETSATPGASGIVNP